jgi:hypothetical protein
MEAGSGLRGPGGARVLVPPRGRAARPVSAGLRRRELDPGPAAGSGAVRRGGGHGGRVSGLLPAGPGVVSGGHPLQAPGSETDSAGLRSRGGAAGRHGGAAPGRAVLGGSGVRAFETVEGGAPDRWLHRAARGGAARGSALDLSPGTGRAAHLPPLRARRTALGAALGGRGARPASGVWRADPDPGVGRSVRGPHLVAQLLPASRRPAGLLRPASQGAAPGSLPEARAGRDPGGAVDPGLAGLARRRSLSGEPWPRGADGLAGAATGRSASRLPEPRASHARRVSRQPRPLAGGPPRPGRRGGGDPRPALAAADGRGPAVPRGVPERRPGPAPAPPARLGEARLRGRRGGDLGSRPGPGFTRPPAQCGRGTAPRSAATTGSPPPPGRP